MKFLKVETEKLDGSRLPWLITHSPRPINDRSLLAHKQSLR